MSDVPHGFNSLEEYIEHSDRTLRSRKGAFYISLTSHGQTRQDRGTTAGQFGAYWASAVGDSSLYDEAYGPSNRVRRGGYFGGHSYDEGLVARRNSRDDAEARESAVNAEPPKKKRKKSK